MIREGENMILPEEFKEKWNINKDGPLIQFDNELINIPFSDEVKRFLLIGGLPETPPPYLEFLTSQSMLTPVVSKLGMPEEFREYWYLGTTGSGDPVCIKENQECLVYLDNGDNYKEVFINSTINQFADCLLKYIRMIDEAVRINGEDAFIDNNIPRPLIDWLISELGKIDSKCMDDGSFWFNEVESLSE